MRMNDFHSVLGFKNMSISACLLVQRANNCDETEICPNVRLNLNATKGQKFVYSLIPRLRLLPPIRCYGKQKVLCPADQLPLFVILSPLLSVKQHSSTHSFDSFSMLNKFVVSFAGRVHKPRDLIAVHQHGSI